MQYISAEEFLKQPKEVQEVFLNWWKPQMYDLFFRNFGNNSNFFLNGIYISCIQDGETLNNATKDKSFLPLLTEGQLREFIEDKTGKTLSIMKSLEGKNEYLITLHHLGLEGDPLSLYREYDNLGNDVLQAYWKVACMITKEDKYERN